MIGLLFLIIFANMFVLFFVVYSFGTVDLGIVVSKMCEYISSYGGFRFTMRKYYFGLSCLVVVIFLMCLLIHILIKMSLIVGHSRCNLNAERPGKEKVLIIQIIPFAFVSHSIDPLVCMLSKGVGLRISVML